jgi:hypothetical protein
MFKKELSIKYFSEGGTGETIGGSGTSKCLWDSEHEPLEIIAT